MFCEVRRHHFAKQPLLCGAVLEHDVGGHVGSHKITYDFVVAAAMHTRGNVLPGNPQPFQIAMPRKRVDRHRIYDDAVQIEDQSQAASQW